MDRARSGRRLEPSECCSTHEAMLPTPQPGNRYGECLTRLRIQKVARDDDAVFLSAEPICSANSPFGPSSSAFLSC